MSNPEVISHITALCTNYPMSREVKNATPLSPLHTEHGADGRTRTALMCSEEELHQSRFHRRERKGAGPGRATRHETV